MDVMVPVEHARESGIGANSNGGQQKREPQRKRGVIGKWDGASEGRKAEALQGGIGEGGC